MRGTIRFGRASRKGIAIAIAIRTLVKVGFGGFGGFGSRGGEDFRQITQLAGVVLTRMATAIDRQKPAVEYGSAKSGKFGGVGVREIGGEYNDSPMKRVLNPRNCDSATYLTALLQWSQNDANRQF